MNVKDVGSFEGCDLANVMTQSVTTHIKEKDIKHCCPTNVYQQLISLGFLLDKSHNRQ